MLEALRLKKNIVPFILRDFEFPKPPRITLSRKAIPPDILELRYYQGVAASQDYFDSSLERLKKLFRYQPGQTAEAPVPQYEQINEPPAPAMQAPQEITISDEPAPRPVPQAKTKRNLGMVLIALFSVLVGLACGLGIGFGAKSTQTKSPEEITTLIAEARAEYSHQSTQRSMQNDDDDLLRAIIEYEVDSVSLMLNKEIEEAFRRQGLGYDCLSYMEAGDYNSYHDLLTEIQGKITAGDYFTAGISTDGTVLLAGDQSSLYSAAFWQDTAMLVAGSNDLLGIKHDGTLLYTDPAADLDPTGHYIGATAGNESFLAYRKDGSTFAHGQLYKTWKALSSWENVIAADAHRDFYIALTPDNELYVFNGSSSQSFEGNKVVWDIATGHGFCLLMYEDGTVAALGNNQYGQCNVEAWRDIIAIDASTAAAFGLKNDGTVITTDPELQAALSSWSEIVAISAGAEHIVGLRADGSVVAAGRNDEGQCDVSDWVLLEFEEPAIQLV